MPKTVVSNITDAQITLPACPTVICEDISLLSREEWLRRRQSCNVTFIKDLGIFLPVCWGGSNEAAILGLSIWGTEAEFWKILRGGSLAIEREMPEESLALGHKFEDEIAEKFAAKEGLTLIPCKQMYQSKDYPWMIADFDYLAVDYDGEIVGVEIKYTDQFNFDFKRLIRNGGVPAYYEAQMRHYMAVSGLKKWYIAVGSSEGNLSKNKMINNVESTFIEWDEEPEEEMVEAGRVFIEKVVNGIEPDMTEVEDTSLALDALLRIHGYADPKKTVELSSVYRKKFEKVLEQNQKIAELEQALKEEQKRLDTLTVPFVQALQNAKTGYLELEDGSAFIAEYDIKKRKTLDKNEVKKLAPDLYDKYLKTSGPQLVKKNNPDIYENCLKESVSQSLNFRKVEK